MPLPPMEFAPVVARRLAKYGVNCVRLHAIDHRWPNGILMRARTGARENHWHGGQDQSTRALDPEGLARLDYFVHCCKEQGIYSDLNLNVARTFTEADGVIQAEKVRWGKSLVYFDSTLIALQKEYAAQLIDHVNPFTGLRYGDEPAIVLIELVNENSLLEFWARGLLGGGEPEPARGNYYNVPLAYVEQLDQLWNVSLRTRYSGRQTLEAAWEGDLGPYEDPVAGSVRRLRPDHFGAASAARFREEAQFYIDIEKGYFSDMSTYLRRDLGAQQLILGTSDHFHDWSALPFLETNATLDVMDGHFYWQHPRSRRPGYHWRPNDWWIANTPMVDEPDASLIAHCSRGVVQGHPYIVSELNEPYPNDYASEFVPIAAAYGLLQDWDGLMFYDFDGGWGTLYWEDELWREEPRAWTFEFSTDPVKWTQTALGALMFLRGDVQAARETIERAMPHDHVLDSLRAGRSVRRPGDREHPFWMSGLPGRLALVHRTAIVDFHADALAPAEGEIALPDGHIISDTGELTWENTPGDGRVQIDTPRHQVLIGRAGQSATSNVALDLSTPFAAVQVASLGDAGIPHAAHLLLVTGARIANTGMRWEDERRQSTGEQWGHAPVRLEPVTGTLSLRGLDSARAAILQPLDAAGQPVEGEARPFVRSGESFTIELTGSPATPWHLIEIER
jgi:hypothetical protein